MGKQESLKRVLSALQDAALDDTLWPRAAALIDDACGLSGHALVVGEGFAKDARVYFANFYFRGHRRQDLEREYFDLYHPWDERVPRLRRLPDGKVAHVTKLYSEGELKTSLVYNEGLPRLGSQNGLLTRLDGPDGLRIVWAIGNPAVRDGWQTAQTAMIERLLNPIRQFVRFRQALGGAQALGSSLSGLMDNKRIGVIQLDRRGRVVEANTRALDLLRRGDGLYDRDGCLSAWLPADNSKLGKLLARALPLSGGQGVAGSISIGRSPGLPRLALHASPVNAGYLDFGARRVAALLLVVDPESQPRLDSDLVAEVLGLTASESEVAVMLSEGRTPHAIAEATGRRVGTVYILVKRAYRKLGVSRQADLVRKLLQLSDVTAL